MTLHLPVPDQPTYTTITRTINAPLHSSPLWTTRPLGRRVMGNSMSTEGHRKCHNPLAKYCHGRRRGGRPGGGDTPDILDGEEPKHDPNTRANWAEKNAMFSQDPHSTDDNASTAGPVPGFYSDHQPGLDPGPIPGLDPGPTPGPDSGPGPGHTPKRPNFLIIVADDLGFSDTSPYGGEIDTPNLMRLATEGLRMTDFHTAASCSPTRAMLMSGTDAHIAGLGIMAEKKRKAPEVFADKPGYEGYLNFRVAALPEILQDAGYLTMMSGKWHLGLTKEVAPCSRGFTKVIASLPGAGNHFNHEPQLYDQPEGAKPKAILKGDGIWMENDKFIHGRHDLPKNFYSSDFFTDRLVQHLDDRTEEEREQPFLGYLAFTAPHWPLQAPKHAIEKYRGVYDAGPQALRERRVAALIKKGLVSPTAVPAPLHTLGETPWDEMSPEQQAHSSRTMEIYAAMVDMIDANIGKLLDYLRSTEELDNTFIIFLSDNGAEGQLLEAAPILAGYTLQDVIEKYYNNSLKNLGQHDSFAWYGPQWASAATAPSRAVKSFTTEGGIRCPCIVRYPPLVKQPGGVSHSLTTVMDVLPTMLDLAGIPRPGPVFREREVVHVRGKSWVPLLQDVEATVYNPEADAVGWEQLGVAAVRLGRWKAVMLPPPKGRGEWELYDLETDPGEGVDLGGEMPEKLKEMVVQYERYFQETGMFDAYGMYNEALKKKGVTHWR